MKGTWGLVGGALMAAQSAGAIQLTISDPSKMPKKEGKWGIWH